MSDPRVPASVRARVAARAGHRCEYCRCPEAFSASPFCVEHITPVSRGGGSGVSNLAFSCAGCNAHKYDRVTGMDPLSGDEAPLYHPRKQRWEDHFVWSADSLEVIGLSRTGRATTETLCLNRRNIRNLRRLLIAVGEHPPESAP
ncbi:MAG: HNH endonuclease [Verrucomicrobiaceae bacterium]|jgi:hypothetical protein|nr:HNH endonuclease [Verrucomicrobiaceae bacterium]